MIDNFVDLKALVIVVSAILAGWVLYEYLSPWGTVRRLRDMEDDDER